MATKYSVTEVFVPGGMPEHTYVSRTNLNLEDRLISASKNLCKLMAITGSTKSGKTVVTRKIYQPDRAIWINGGTVGSEDDFWNTILYEMEGYTSISHSTSSGKQMGAGLNIGAAQAGVDRKSEKIRSESLSVSPLVAATRELRRSRMPLIIDDFHYLPRELQGKIIRGLKSLIFEGNPVVIIAIPHRRYDAVKVEREITGRLETVSVPAWELPELMQIAKDGFPLLNISVPERVLVDLASEAYGSPHLMQEFCRGFAERYEVRETAKRTVHLDSIPEDLFTSVASDTGKLIYDKLSHGPRQRSDRKQRRLKSGKTADIYGVTLLALSTIEPGLVTVDYEKLRSAMREILDDPIPQAHEVSRVLRKMSKIAKDDESSTPVIDWEDDEKRLHITDPFFAFYLKWGLRT